MHVSAERRVCTIPANRRSRSLFLRSMDLDMCGSGARGGGGGGSGLFISSFPQVGVSILNTM